MEVQSTEDASVELPRVKGGWFRKLKCDFGLHDWSVWTTPRPTACTRKQGRVCWACGIVEERFVKHGSH